MHLGQDRCFHLYGGLKELLLLFFPILFMTFSTYLFILVEKVFLARVSADAMEAAVNAAYACQIFQVPCIAIAMMAQVSVGRWYGASEWRTIGPGIWQFIWFSFLSMVITFPLSIVYAKFYFQEKDFEGIALPYFYFYASINFLYPLGTALACFYLGQGKTRLVSIVTLVSQIIKLFLAYLLIFGWGKWIPALGLMGGVVSTLIVQGGFCLVLLGVFLNPQHTNLYHSRSFYFRPKLFWECIQPGFLRAISRVLMLTCWASIAHLMTVKGGDYSLILSIGGTIFLFLPFLGEAICQAQTTVISNLLGAQNYGLMHQAFRSGGYLVLATIVLFGIPFLLFPLFTFDYLFPKVILDESVIRLTFFGIWICFSCYTFCYIPISYILAFKDTRFMLFMGIFNWINGFLLMYVAIEIFHMKADSFWLILSLMHGSLALLYYLRMKKLELKVYSDPSPKAI